MHTKAKVLLAAATTALAFAGIAGAEAPPSAHYPWVQLPAWVGTGTTGVLTVASQPGVQPPAGIPPAGLTHAPAIAGSSYPWVQPPAWVGTGAVGAPLAGPGHPWVQPPAFIPTT